MIEDKPELGETAMGREAFKSFLLTFCLAADSGPCT